METSVRSGYEGISVETANDVSTITIESQPLNLLSRETMTSLVAAFKALGGDAQTRCIVPRGASRPW
jgi:enoyl-CoA hydratase/carnithine racemase